MRKVHRCCKLCLTTSQRFFTVALPSCSCTPAHFDACTLCRFPCFLCRHSIFALSAPILLWGGISDFDVCGPQIWKKIAQKNSGAQAMPWRVVQTARPSVLLHRLCTLLRAIQALEVDLEQEGKTLGSLQDSWAPLDRLELVMLCPVQQHAGLPSLARPLLAPHKVFRLIDYPWLSSSLQGLISDAQQAVTAIARARNPPRWGSDLLA